MAGLMIDGISPVSSGLLASSCTTGPCCSFNSWMSFNTEVQWKGSLYPVPDSFKVKLPATGGGALSAVWVSLASGMVDAPSTSGP